jgi:hypothetical protein
MTLPHNRLKEEVFLESNRRERDPKLGSTGSLGLVAFGPPGPRRLAHNATCLSPEPQQKAQFA